ncbi:DUF1761 family protein [Pseudooceanicola sp. 216_PA32_1]|uniref:DUF1761 family protein n=1 Tax=Pseudooceanicola pacificus TaxID=2676438 RepID=A0A844VYS6_9RHOB|nr:DUF1761 domain-containing protein [Pseudooceanicola pacificus]MWB76906.1 DUF1761 family protein [Pseudooceanicola pacificus]
MGFVEVLAAAAAGFAMGAVWYMTFSGVWLKATGLELDEKGQPVETGSYGPFVVAGIAMILVAGMMRHVFAMSGIDGAGESLVAGLGIGAFFITPWVAMNYAYAQRRPMLTIIDGGYSVLGAGVIGLVLGLV